MLWSSSWVPFYLCIEPLAYPRVGYNVLIRLELPGMEPGGRVTPPRSIVGSIRAIRPKQGSVVSSGCNSKRTANFHFMGLLGLGTIRRACGTQDGSLRSRLARQEVGCLVNESIFDVY